MAIVKMHKISVIGLESDRKAILKTLMKLGVVEIIDTAGYAFIERDQMIAAEGQEKTVESIEGDLARVKSALESLSSYENRKKGLFEPKRAVNEKEYHEIVWRSEEVWQVIHRIAGYDDQLLSLRAEENKLQNMVASLQPWMKLQIPFEVEETGSTKIQLGTMPAIADVKELQEQLQSRVPESYMEVISNDRDQYYLLVICYKKSEEPVTQVLKQFSFSKVSFKEMTGTAEENAAQCRRRMEEIGEERKEIKSSIGALVDRKMEIEVIHDDLLIQRDHIAAVQKLAKTEKVFWLEGWVPHDLSQKVADRLNRHWDVIVEVKLPDKEEEHPILLKNPSLVQPFELITQLYSLPSSKGIDPNLFMAPFYFLFFGLMVSDAGYGLAISLITGFVLWRYKLEGMAHKLIKLLFLGGISTFIWGALFGGWFGNIVDAVTQGKYTVPALWFNPLDDPMRLLIWSFIFGGIHLFVGMGLQAYRLIRDGKVLDAVFDIGLWYILLIGVVLLALGGTPGYIGKYMAILGAVGLVLTQGRAEKNIFKKLLTGVLSLYNITGYLSDVLSYSRLLALGLATGVIANVVNTMGTLFGLNIGGIIVLTIIFIVGHTFNIAINALGAYVHSSRLQYVEFFGKFYESGGKEFKPFTIKTKYIDLKNEEVS